MSKILKKIIVIENENKEQCDTLEELVKILLDDDYYKFDKEKRKEIMKQKAYANCINNKYEVVEDIDIKEIKDLDNKFVIKDEMTYILSLLITNNVLLLERKDSNVFTKEFRKEEIEDNYIIVNKFAKKILYRYISIK